MTTKIVFVHLNSTIPSYLKMNIQSTKKKFPNSKIILIHDQISSIKLDSNVQQFRYSPDQESETILNYLSHPRDFRNNFWFSSIQRFDALRQYLAQNPGPILHLESDVIISADFPLADFFFNCELLAFPLVANNRGVASSLYLSSLSVADQLVSLSTEMCKVNSTTTDMEILAQFSKTFPEQTFHLSFGPNSEEAYVSDFQLDGLAPSFEKFHGVFDGNDMGVHLFGTDPRNSRGISYVGREIPGNFSTIKNWQFLYDSERQFINIKYNGVILPVFSIHATSKQLLLFNRHSQDWMIRRYLNGATGVVKIKKYPLIFVKMGIKKILKLINR